MHTYTLPLSGTGSPLPGTGSPLPGQAGSHGHSLVLF